MSESNDRRSPIAVGMEWVARIVAISLLMFSPGLAGQWLDNRWGTSFLTFSGFLVGLVAGMVCLLVMTGSIGSR